MEPITFENLKPWPEQGDAITTRSSAGWKSRMKWKSGVLVYMHTRESSRGPFASGM